MMMATNVRAVLTASFLLMLAITLSVNAKVVQEQGGQEDNGEMSREILHNNKQGRIIDQMKKEILALLQNDQQVKAQANLYDSNLFEGDLNLPKKEIEDAYGPTSKPEEAEAEANLYGSNLFEGDLDLPKKEIEDAYGKSSEAELQKTSSINALWNYGIVYYDFDNSVPLFLRNIIRGAMDEYEINTCLKFNFRFPTSTGITQFIRFQSISAKGCVSNSIGKAIGYQQTINLASPGCDTHGTAVHEIGHAIGFWHEQSRPDRNNYLNINWQNIKTGRASQFDLRNAVDYHGEKYDYTSIMHYELKAFNSNGQPTMSVNNLPRYTAQGSPTIGNKPHLSAADIRQVNKLYKCYNSLGYQGRLSVHVQKATGLPHSVYYAEIIAYNNFGTSEVYTTQNSVTTSPAHYSWTNAITTTYKNWRYFEIRIKNSYGNVVIGRQTIWIEGVNVADSYCMANNCVYFTYQIKY